MKKDWTEGEEEPLEVLRRIAEILRCSATDAIFDPGAELRREPSEELKSQVLHSILNSAIDADKLDYLLRDSYHCGVRYGSGIDHERFFQSLTTVSHLARPKGEAAQAYHPSASFGVTSKGVHPVESILIARYQMFNSVYWHHTARAETAMLQYLVQEHLGSGTTEEGVQARLDELILRFREFGDKEALNWLVSMTVGKARRNSSKKAEVLRRIGSALSGRRSELYWPAFELRYEQEHNRLDQGQTKAKEVFVNLTAISDGLAEARTVLEFLHLARSLRKSFAAMLVRNLEQCSQRIRIDEGELLVDIPPSGADQIDNIFVRVDDKIRLIQELSPIADAVRATFTFWARQVRVFLAPAVWERCSDAGVEHARIAACCWDCMLEIADEQEPQLLLFKEIPPTN